MATGYWRIVPTFIPTRFELFDHTPIETDRTSVAVQILIPGATAYETLTVSDLGSYDLANPHSFPLTIDPADVAAETGSSFRDGLYRFKITFVIGSDTYTFEEYFLFIPESDRCIRTKLDTYLKSVCNLCKETKQLNTLQELVVLRQGTLIDVDHNEITAAKEKIVLMQNICNGTGCTCACGCS